MTLKLKVSNEFLLLEQQREPQDVVGPHLAERNLVLFEPLRPHFYRTIEGIVDLTPPKN